VNPSPGKGPAVRSAPRSEIAAGRDPGRPSGAAALEREAELLLGVIIPFRNETAVLQRKLRNLAEVRWPFHRQPHRIVLVDDGSEDGSFELAQRLCAELFVKPSGTNRMTVPAITGTVPAAAEVLRSSGKAGKAGAIRTGLTALGSSVDLVILTDADVIIRPTSFLNLTQRFREREDLAMACGRQQFVKSLAPDGSCRGADGHDLVDASDGFDRASAAVRAWESRRGRLFSVHGQLLAWRERLGLCPTPGVAADDLDLMFQVRDRGLPIELLTGVTFVEVKLPDGPARKAQALRRAAAWFQVMAGRRAPRGAPLFDRLQLAAYGAIPLLASPLLHLVIGVIVLAGGWLAGLLVGRALSGAWEPGGAAALWGAGAGLVLLIAGALAAPGRALRALSAQWPVIRAARAAHAQGHGSDRWEPPRA